MWKILIKMQICDITVGSEANHGKKKNSPLPEHRE